MNARHTGHDFQKRRGFTFVEALAAMVFVAIVIPTAVKGVLIASRLGIAAERRALAARLAGVMLDEWIVTGEWEDADADGDFGDENPGYRWELTEEDWEEDALTLITLEAFYVVQGQEFSVRLSTLVESAAQTQTEVLE